LLIHIPVIEHTRHKHAVASRDCGHGMWLIGTSSLDQERVLKWRF
jgi:hypothetical protein